MDWKQLLSNKRKGEYASSELPAIRNPFEQDYDRIIFSHPFRSLQDKTQVFPLPEQDFVHTRLTHSLEVSSVARSLGKKVSQVLSTRYKETHSMDAIPAIVAAAALAHDIGNPPFGHAGEEAIRVYFRQPQVVELLNKYLTPHELTDLQGYEGNAQGFRLLNKTNFQGLRLTQATLAAFTKYPCESVSTNQGGLTKSRSKFGFFQCNKELFGNLAQDLGLLTVEGTSLAWSRHPLAFIVEAADDICYHVIDLEDGCRLGLVSYDQTRDLLAQIVGERYKPEKLNAIPSKDERIGMLRALAIGQLIHECQHVFLEHEKEILAGTFDSALTDVVPSAAALQTIKSISVKQIYRCRAVTEREIVGFEVLGGLLESFIRATINQHHGAANKRDERIIRLIPPIYVSNEPNLYEIILNCLDYIVGMTDSSAVSVFKKIKGIDLPGV